MRWPWRTLIERGIHRFPLAFYAGGIGVLTPARHVRVRAAGPWRSGCRAGNSALFTLVFLLCASQLAVALMNWLSTLLVKPRLLPRLDYSAGIAAGLPHDGGRAHDAHQRRRAWIACSKPWKFIIWRIGIRICTSPLLTDFRDAPEEILPGDEALLQRARAGVEMLNRKYPSDGTDLFFLFHRPRRWNAGEGLWMGYERKRGKLTEFNALLRGGSRGCFSEIVGRHRPSCPPSSMSSRSTPTPNCRAMPPASSSARWPIR